MKTSGPHNPDDVLIGFLDSPEVKALAEIVTECERAKSVADFFRAHIAERAAAYGIMTNGVVQDKWRVRVAARAEAIRQAKKRRQRNIEINKEAK